MIHLVFVRHAESIRNFATDLARDGETRWLKDQLADDMPESEWPLTPAGEFQASFTGNWIREQGILDTHVASRSPFHRTIQTSELLGIDSTWHNDDRFRERQWGKTPPNYSIENYLSDLTQCSNFVWKGPYPGSESIADLVPNVSPWLDGLVDGGSHVVVTHGGTLLAIQRVIESNPPIRRLGNCAVLEYRIERTASVWAGESRYALPVFGLTTPTPWVKLNA